MCSISKIYTQGIHFFLMWSPVSSVTPFRLHPSPSQSPPITAGAQTNINHGIESHAIPPSTTTQYHRTLSLVQLDIALIHLHLQTDVRHLKMVEKANILLRGCCNDLLSMQYPLPSIPQGQQSVQLIASRDLNKREVLSFWGAILKRANSAEQTPFVPIPFFFFPTGMLM